MTRVMQNGQQRKLEFTPLEFETHLQILHRHKAFSLEFTPLEFETKGDSDAVNAKIIRIYSVGV